LLYYLTHHNVTALFVNMFLSDEDKILMKTSGYAMVVHGRPQTPKIQVLGGRTAPGVVQPLYSRGHN